MADRWLSIVGIGEEGRAGLSATALALIEAAELVVGGARHLELIGPVRGERLVWASPLERTIPAILARRDHPKPEPDRRRRIGANPKAQSRFRRSLQWLVHVRTDRGIEHRRHPQSGSCPNH